MAKNEERFKRVKALITDESIQIKNEDDYDTLLGLLTEEDFNKHIDAVKAMTSDGNKYTMEAIEVDSSICLKIKNETSGEEYDPSKKSEDDKGAEKKAEDAKKELGLKTEEKKEEEDKSKEEDAKDEKKASEASKNTEDKKEEKKEIDFGKQVMDQMAKLMEMVSSGAKSQASMVLEMKSFQDNMSKELFNIKKKQKDLMDTLFIAKAFSHKEPLAKSLDLGDKFKSIFPTEMQGETIKNPVQRTKEE